MAYVKDSSILTDMLYLAYTFKFRVFGWQWSMYKKHNIIIP